MKKITDFQIITLERTPYYFAKNNEEYNELCKIFIDSFRFSVEDRTKSLTENIEFPIMVRFRTEYDNYSETYNVYNDICEYDQLVRLKVALDNLPIKTF